VESEVEGAFERERRTGREVLFPVRLDESVMKTGVSWAAAVRRTRHIGDFRGWKGHDAFTTAFARLLRDLRGEESAEAAEPGAAPKRRRRGKVFTKDDALWRTVGMARSKEPTNIAEHKHAYIADAVHHVER
jgi:hypothetical protein